MSKVNTARTDSSPSSEDYRDHPDDAAGHGATTHDDRGVYLIVEPGHCACGCEQQVAKGSQFRQGHDARLKGILQRAHMRGSEIHLITGSEMISTDAMKLAQERGWVRFLEQAEAKAHLRAEKLARRAVAKADKAVAKSQKARNKANLAESDEKPSNLFEAKVGRWTYKGFSTPKGDFHYTDKQGNAKVAKAGTWTKVG